MLVVVFMLYPYLLLMSVDMQKTISEGRLVWEEN